MSQPGEDELLGLRASIDNLDVVLVFLMAERFKLTRAVGCLKARHDFPAVDPLREHAQVKRLRLLASESGLDPDSAEKLLGLVISEVIQHHQVMRQIGAR